MKKNTEKYRTIKKICLAVIINIFVFIWFTGCSKSTLTPEEIHPVETNVNQSSEIVFEELEIENAGNTASQRTPMKPQWQDGDTLYDVNDTIYYKNYYDNFTEGYMMDIRFCDVNLQKELEDYFLVDQNSFDVNDKLVALFYDNRTIEMSEDELKELFFKHGYELSLHHAEFANLHVRFVEFRELDSLSLYSSRIFIQTWNEEHVYVEDITGPFPRKIRGIILIDDKEKPQLIVHCTSVSNEYVAEEEISFWEFHDTYWVLIPMNLKINTSHAHIAGDNYPDEDRNVLFEKKDYRDGIVYKCSVQPGLPSHNGVDYYTIRLGVLEEIEKNRKFRMIAIYDVMGRTEIDSGRDCYIEFCILP